MATLLEMSIRTVVKADICLIIGRDNMEASLGKRTGLEDPGEVCEA
jgi:hypothetical protein